MLFRLSALVFVLTSVSVFATELLPLREREKMADYLDSVKSSFEALYAPREWKAEFAGWDLEKIIENAKTEVFDRPEMSIQEFHKILRKVFLSTKDYHVSVRFYSTEKASLPFHVVLAEGKYYVGFVDRTQASAITRELEVGDEILEFAGRPVAEVAQEIVDEMGGNTKETDSQFGAYVLTRRSTRSGLDVPSGPVEVKFKNLGLRQLAWDYTPEFFGRSDSPVGTLGEPSSLSDRISEFSMEWDHGNVLSEDFGNLANPHEIGGRKSPLPPLGKIIWQTEESNPFYAYVFKMPIDDKKNFRLQGYVRIPKYGAGVTEAIAFARILQKMNELETESLVIDQLNNPGGSVFYLYTLVSMLIDEAVKTPKHHIAIDAGTLGFAQEIIEVKSKIENDADAVKILGETVSGYPVDETFYINMLKYATFLKEQWDAKVKLSGPTHLFGVDQINPAPLAYGNPSPGRYARYTKKILLLINEFDFSGGDFFPAILQDNKRVKVMGVRTAGAGGYVKTIEYPNDLLVESYRLTGSLAARVNGQPIENLGVQPDEGYEYEITAADIRNGYPGYREAILAKLLAFLRE